MHLDHSISPVRGLRAWWEHHILFEPKDWIQVEVTTACNAACFYCPRTVYREKWHNRFLPWHLFQRLIPTFAHTDLVHLQGWGEPLLHPDLPAMVALAKAGGARVGTTTNGMLLDSSMAEALVASGLDVLAFSLAGTSPALNDRFRAGTRIDTVMANMALLESVKRRFASSTPVVHIAYLLLASGITEIESLPSLLRGTAVREVVVSLLDFESDPQRVSGEVLKIDTSDQKRRMETLFEKLRASGREMGISIHTPTTDTIRRSVGCSENIQNALCISARGDVSPCVRGTLLSARKDAVSSKGHRPHHPLVFGNIMDQWLPVIWRDPAYAHWRTTHAAGGIPPVCASCAKLRN